MLQESPRKVFLFFYTCIWMILVAETQYYVGPDVISMKTEKKNLSANACGYLKFITMVKLHRKCHHSLIVQNLVWISSISNSIIYIIMCGLFKNEVTRKIQRKSQKNVNSEKTKIFNTNETKSYCSLSLTDVWYLDWGSGDRQES